MKTTGSATPKYKIGDRVTVVDYGFSDDQRREYTLAITELHANYGGAGVHRYYGTVRGRGEIGAYEHQIAGLK